MPIIIMFIFILVGITKCFKKKFILHGAIQWAIPIMLMLDGDWSLEYLLSIKTFILMTVFFIWRYRATYIIFNVKKEEVIKLIHELLQKHEIQYEDYEDKIILPELYNDTKVTTGLGKSEIVKVYNKEIKIRGESEVYLDIMDLKGMSLYENIIKEIKLKLNELSIEERHLFHGGRIILLSMIFMGIIIWKM